MYRPSAFAVDDPAELRAFIDARPFALLLGPGLEATHLPVLRTDDHHLQCHLAAPNPQGRALAAAPDGTEVLVVFTGPHGYVSPRWYETGEAVPTWNYTAVHVRGRALPLDGEAALEAAMGAMLERFEPEPSIREIVTPQTVARMLPGVRGLSIRIDSVQGVYKLSQNRSEVDRAGVVDGLEAGSAGDRALAGFMRRGGIRTVEGS